LIGGSGGSIEHFEAIISTFKFEKFTKKIMSLPKFWLTEENLIIFCKQGEEIKISCLEESDKISVFSANQNNHFAKICSEGLKWKLQNVNWKKQVSLSNRKSELTNKNSQNDTDVSIFAKRGNFLIILPLKDSIKVSNSCKKD
jgi:thiamine pyrophosphokinase